MSKKIITLFALEKLWAEHLKKETGKIYAVDYPIELTPAYVSYCRRTWGAWDQWKNKRIEQLAKMGMLETHAIDYYESQDPIRP